MFVLQCRVDSIISLLGKYSCWRQRQKSPGAEGTVTMSWVHVSDGETALGDSRPLERLQTETKTCLLTHWNSGRYCIRASGFGSYGALCVLLFGKAEGVWSSCHYLFPLIQSGFAWRVLTCTRPLWGGCSLRLPLTARNCSPTQSSFQWQWLNQPRSHACFYTTITTIVC